MKLIINYDLMKKINQAKKGNEILLLEHSFKKTIPGCGIIFLHFLGSKELKDFSQVINSTTVSTSILLLMNLISDTYKNLPYISYKKTEALNELKKIASQLNNLNIDTSSDLLLKSKEYERNYKFYINEKKIIEVLQEKYIIIPTYHKGNIVETSVLQEHVIGSKVYVLSLGSPLKTFKPALAGA